MNLTIFMDETSRTGQQRYNNDKWNFQNQPCFGLGALYIPSDKIEHFRQELESIFKKENFQHEFKWSNKAARGRVKRLFPELIKIIDQNGVKVHFEIEDKRFTLAKIITDYCILPYYDLSDSILSDHCIHYLKRAFASYIANNMSDELLWEICSFFDSHTHDTKLLKNLIKKISAELDTKAINEYCASTIQHIEMAEATQTPPKYMFPIRDTIRHNGIETTLTIDPHTDCFSNLLTKAIEYFPNYKEILCVHDDQEQWKPALEETIKRIHDSNLFGDHVFTLNTQRGYDIIINTVDYILGYLNSELQNLFTNNTPLTKELNDLCESHFTLVASANLQEKVFKHNPQIIVVKQIVEAIALKK